MLKSQYFEVLGEILEYGKILQKCNLEKPVKHSEKIKKYLKILKEIRK